MIERETLPHAPYHPPHPHAAHPCGKIFFFLQYTVEQENLKSINKLINLLKKQRIND